MLTENVSEKLYHSWIQKRPWALFGNKIGCKLEAFAVLGSG